MKPYYDIDGVTIYHGDCRAILPQLEQFDLVLTDPPYGIARVWKGGHGKGWGRARAAAEVRNSWDSEPPNAATLCFIRNKARDAVVWGGNYFILPPSRGWLVWNKPERGFSLAEAELAWTSRDAVIRVFDGPRSDPEREHPTQKPLNLMSWCLGQFPDAKSVLDPYMGSGTTLLAARERGLRAVGIDIHKDYCAMAARRLKEASLFFPEAILCR